MGNINDKFLLTQNNDDICSSISQPFEQHENESFHDDEVNIYLIDSKAPCVIKNDENSYLYMILPINII